VIASQLRDRQQVRHEAVCYVGGGPGCHGYAGRPAPTTTTPHPGSRQRYQPPGGRGERGTPRPCNAPSWTFRSPPQKPPFRSRSRFIQSKYVEKRFLVRVWAQATGRGGVKGRGARACQAQALRSMGEGESLWQAVAFGDVQRAMWILVCGRASVNSAQGGSLQRGWGTGGSARGGGGSPQRPSSSADAAETAAAGWSLAVPTLPERAGAAPLLVLGTGRGAGVHQRGVPEEPGKQPLPLSKAGSGRGEGGRAEVVGTKRGHE